MKAVQLLAGEFCGSNAFKEAQRPMTLPKSIKLPEEIPEFIRNWGVVAIEQNFVDRKNAVVLKQGHNTYPCRIAISDFIGNKIYQPFDIPEEAVVWVRDLPDAMTNNEIKAFIINDLKLEAE